MTSETIVAPTWRLFALARTATTVVGAMALLAGSCGRFVARAPSQRARASRLAVGGAIALVCVVSLEAIYRAISWVVAGGTEGLSPASTFLPQSSLASGLYGAAGSSETVQQSTVGAVARSIAVTGLSSVSVGCGVWAIGAHGGPLHRRGTQGIAIGVVLLALSVGARVFAAVNYAVGWVL